MLIFCSECYGLYCIMILLYVHPFSLTDTKKLGGDSKTSYSFRYSFTAPRCCYTRSKAAYLSRTFIIFNKQKNLVSLPSFISKYLLNQMFTSFIFTEFREKPQQADNSFTYNFKNMTLIKIVYINNYNFKHFHEEVHIN